MASAILQWNVSALAKVRLGAHLERRRVIYDDALVHAMHVHVKTVTTKGAATNLSCITLVQLT